MRLLVLSRVNVRARHCRDFVLPGVKNFQKKHEQIVHVRTLTQAKIVRDMFGMVSFFEIYLVIQLFFHFGAYQNGSSL